MLKDLTDFDHWVAPPTIELLSDRINKANEDRPKGKIVSWKNFTGQFSPLQVYTYLKVRFDLPNGYTMLAKTTDSADNLIHWHYTIRSAQTTMDFFGHSSGMEIIAKHPEYDFLEEDRELFVKELKQQFASYGKQMKAVKHQFEHWSLFINPFVRLYRTIHELIDDLERLDIEEPSPLTWKSTSDEIQIHKKEMDRWTGNVATATSLGTVLRMLFPVLAESFVNLVIFKFSKPEYKKDKRLYENLIRSQIDIRVKKLHIDCDEFDGPIDGEDQRFKKFHTLMNQRNDNLHGNVNPQSLQVEDMFFDMGFTPLYETDEGIIKKVFRKYTIGVSLRDVLDDEAVVSDFMALILEKLSQKGFEFFVRLMGERFPGINKKTDRIGILLPEHYAEGAAFTGQKIEEDSDYHWFVGNDGEFELYLPISWIQQLKEDKYYFHVSESEESDYMILSVRELGLDAEKKKRHLEKQIRKEIGDNTFYVFEPMDAGIMNLHSYTVVTGTTHILFTCAVVKDNNSNQTKSGLEEMEKIIASFRLIPKERRGNLLQSYHYYSFVKGLATNTLLLDNALRSKAYFEVILLVSNNILALLRIGIVLKTQILEKTNQIEDKWIYQAEDEPLISEVEIYAEVERLSVVDSDLLDKVKAAAIRRTRIMETFIVSPVSIADVEIFGIYLHSISEKINKRIRELEEEQLTKGVGMAKEFVTDDRNMFADLVKGRIAGDSHFKSILLNIKKRT